MIMAVFDLAVHIGIYHFLAFSAVLFCIGLYGLMVKRNMIAILMSIELMLNAVNVNFVAFNHFLPLEELTGQVLTIFSITVGAAEVAVGLALAFRIYRDRDSVNTDIFDKLHG